MKRASLRGRALAEVVALSLLVPLVTVPGLWLATSWWQDRLVAQRGSATADATTPRRDMTLTWLAVEGLDMPPVDLGEWRVMPAMRPLATDREPAMAFACATTNSAWIDMLLDGEGNPRLAGDTGAQPSFAWIASTASPPHDTRFERTDRHDPRFHEPADAVGDGCVRPCVSYELG